MSYYIITKFYVGDNTAISLYEAVIFCYTNDFFEGFGIDVELKFMNFLPYIFPSQLLNDQNYK